MLEFTWCYCSLSRYFCYLCVCFSLFLSTHSHLGRWRWGAAKRGIKCWRTHLPLNLRNLQPPKKERRREPTMIHSIMEDSRGCYGINKKGPLLSLRSSGRVHGCYELSLKYGSAWVSKVKVCKTAGSGNIRGNSTHDSS